MSGRAREPQTLFLIALLAVLPGCGQNRVKSDPTIPPGVSWASLLAEATDLRTLATAVNPEAKACMFSSCPDTNKVMLSHLAPEVIGDMDYGSFTEVVTNNDGVSATLATFNGPGAVTWVWSANPVGILSLYIDGQDHPALSMPFVNFLAGKFLPVREPFAALTSLGHNLHFPIVHAKFCKLVLTVPRTTDLAPLYYQVAWQSLPSNAVIQPFDAAAISRQGDILTWFGQKLVTTSSSGGPSAAEGTESKKLECSPAPGQVLEVFRNQGPRAITALRFTAKSKTDLSGIGIEANWDGETAVRAPLHMLAGVSSALENTESFPATVDGSKVVLRWFMPFAIEGHVFCRNSSDHLCRFSVEAWTEPIEVSRYPLRFQANLVVNSRIPTDSGNILTLADSSRPGRFGGCVLSVDSRSAQWWGEGDNLVWLDDTNSPAVHGTGTEDYFGFAWCSPEVFNHPFRGQTKVVNTGDRRIAQMHRYHILDQLPYQHWGRFQFQALGQGKGEMDWTASVIWYSR